MTDQHNAAANQTWSLPDVVHGPGIDASDQTLAVLGEANCYTVNFIQTYNKICADYTRERVEAGHDLSDKLRRQHSAENRVQLTNEFVEMTIRANLEVSEKMFSAFNTLMADMASLVAIRLNPSSRQRVLR